MPATTRATSSTLAATKAKRTGHISALDADALSVVLEAFVDDGSADDKALIKRLATLRHVNRNWAEVFAKRMYDRTALLVYTQRMRAGGDETSQNLQGNALINSACAISLDSMGYLMYTQLSAYNMPQVSFGVLRIMMMFADAPNHTERLRLMGQGVGLSPDAVTEALNLFRDTQA